MATNIFLRGEGASAAYSARSSHSGAEPTPTIASAEFRRKIRRVVIVASTFLKLGRAKRHPGTAGRDLHADDFTIGQLHGEVHTRDQTSRVEPILARIRIARWLLLPVERLAKLRNLVDQRLGEVHIAVHR